MFICILIFIFGRLWEKVRRDPTPRVASGPLSPGRARGVTQSRRRVRVVALLAVHLHAPRGLMQWAGALASGSGRPRRRGARRPIGAREWGPLPEPGAVAKAPGGNS